MLTEQATALLYGKPLVKPSTIESELEKIRNAAAVQDAARDAERGEPVAARVKATLKNVILLNTQRGALATDTEIDRLIDKVCVAHPSRMFVVDGSLGEGTATPKKPSSAGDQPGLATSVSSRCFLADSGAHVCSEEIYVSAGAASVSLVPNLLISLLAPDVDTVLLVLGDLCRATQEVQQLLRGLVGLSDLVIYDSSEFSDYRAGMLTILSALTPKAVDPVRSFPVAEAQKLYDLNWPRLRRWRSLVAEGFDAERFVTASESISRIRLSVVAEAGTTGDPAAVMRTPEGMLIAGWFLASLGMVPEASVKGSNGAVLAVRCAAADHAPAHGTVTIELAGTPAGVPAAGGDPGSLSGVEIEVTCQAFQGRIDVQRRFDKGTAEITMALTDGGAGAEACESCCDFTARSLPFPTPGFAEKVLLALVARRAESLFRQALELSLKLVTIAGSPAR